jgi:ATPase family protein associated with various cellular activities (AAA)
MIDTASNLELLVRARYALIVLETIEPELAERMVRQIASDLQLHYYSWTRSKGLRRGPSGGVSAGEPYADDAKEPHKALACAEREGAGIFFFRELGPFLEDPLVASHVLDLVSAFGTRRGALIITGQDVRLPDALRPHATTLRLAGPVYDDYRTMLERVIRDQTARMPVRIELTPQDRVRLINNLAGLTLIEAEKVITKLLIEDAALRPNDIQRVIDAKRQAVEQDGLLEYFPAEDGLSSVAGLAGLKDWLTKRRTVVTDPHRAVEFGLSFPKGMLLLGVPGCGKSLCAKAVAREWGLPLLKLDPANLYDKYVGDSEKNFKRAMQTAERLAPIVLWIDELEKAFAGGSGEEDGGVSRRVFGTFLSWLQERKGDVFVVATSNDVAKLPPEFIRKGRFDEIFFVDLPKPAIRAEIFAIHLRKRKQDVGRFDLAALAGATEGFSGAEIEETVVAGLYTAFASGGELSTESLLTEIRRTRPLSRTMAERLDALRQWASERTVAAD